MTTPTIRAALDAAEQHATFHIWAGHPLAIILEGLIKKIRAALNAETPPAMVLGELFDRHCFEDDYGDKYLNAEAFESAALELAAHTALKAEPVGEDYDWEGAIAAVILDHSYVDPERNLSRVLRECDFGATARAILARWGRPAAPPAPEVGEFITQLKRYAKYGTPIRLIPFVVARAATVIQQQQQLLTLAAPAPAVVPVAVTERLPGEGEG